MATALGRHKDAATPARARSAISSEAVLQRPAPKLLPHWSNAPMRRTRRQPNTSATVAQMRSVHPHAKAKADAGQSWSSGGISSSPEMTGMHTVNMFYDMGRV